MSRPDSDGAAVFDSPVRIACLGRLGDQARELLDHVADRCRQGVAIGVFQERVDGPDPDAEVLVAIDTRQPDTGPRRWMGFATFYEINENRLWVAQLWVDEDCRKQGIATALLDRALDVARERGHDAVLLGRAEHNRPMKSLLERSGWQVDHIVHSLKVTP